MFIPNLRYLPLLLMCFSLPAWSDIVTVNGQDYYRTELLSGSGTGAEAAAIDDRGDVIGTAVGPMGDTLAVLWWLPGLGDTASSMPLPMGFFYETHGAGIASNGDLLIEGYEPLGDPSCYVLYMVFHFGGGPLIDPRDCIVTSGGVSLEMLTFGAWPGLIGGPSSNSKGQFIKTISSPYGTPSDTAFLFTPVPAPVPEPASLLLFSIVLGGCLWRRPALRWIKTRMPS